MKSLQRYASSPSLFLLRATFQKKRNSESSLLSITVMTTQTAHHPASWQHRLRQQSSDTDIPSHFIPAQLSQAKLQFPFSFKESSWLWYFLRYRSVCQYSRFQNSGTVYVHTFRQKAGVVFPNTQDWTFWIFANAIAFVRTVSIDRRHSTFFFFARVTPDVISLQLSTLYP
jgi:hypothetical protein